MSRLLFAAARGAMIQYREATYGGWHLSSYLPLFVLPGLTRRIHPEDEHLQYGPISTALRKWAIGGVEYDRLVGDLAVSYLMDSDNIHLTDVDATLKTFALFVAEALADEGM